MAGRLDQAIGVVDGVNVDFRTPFPYAGDSLIVFLNGRQLKRQLDNGWIELDPSAGTFRMKVPPAAARPGSTDDPGDLLACFYNVGDAPLLGGADGGIPEMVSAEVVSPEMNFALDLSPEMIEGLNADDVGTPLVSSAEEVRPKIETAEDLSPTMIGAKEV